MPAATQTKQVIIGSNYRPHRFERRTALTYSALRVEPSLDDLRIQRALTLPPLAEVGRRIDPERIVGFGIAISAFTLVLLTSFGVIK